MANCEKYINMICGLVDGELTAEQEAELRAHLDTCENCTQIYNALAGISDAISEDLVEPPEALAQGIMFKIRKNKNGKLRAFPFGRFTALAACVAIVLLAGNRLGWFSNLDSATPELASMPDSKSFDYSANTLDEGSYDSSTLGGLPAPAPEEFNEEGAKSKSPGDNTFNSAQYGTPEAAITEELASLFNAGSIEIYGGTSTNDGRILSIGDGKAKDSLLKILACSSVDSSEIKLESTQDFTILFSDDSTLRIWIADGVLCYDFGDDILYIAVGSPDDLKNFLLLSSKAY